MVGSFIFSFILLGMLFANYINTKYTALEWENRLAQLKTQLLDSPEDENLLSQVRWLDQQIRNERMRKLVLSQ